MTALTSSPQYTTRAKFYILKVGSSYVLGSKPVATGAQINIIDIGSNEPTFSGTSPLNGSGGSYTVKDNASSGAHHFNMDGGSAYPYSIYVDTSNGASSADFKWFNGSGTMRVFEKYQGSDSFSIEFHKELDAADNVDLYVHCGAETKTLSESVTDGYWNIASPPSSLTVLTFNLEPVTQFAPQFENIGGEDGDLEIEPEEGT